MRTWGLFLERPAGSFSCPESYFVYTVFTFKIKVSIIVTMIQWNYQLSKQNWLVWELVAWKVSRPFKNKPLKNSDGLTICLVSVICISVKFLLICLCIKIIIFWEWIFEGWTLNNLDIRLVQCNPDFSNLLGKWKLVQKTDGSLKSRTWHQITPDLPYWCCLIIWTKKTPDINHICYSCTPMYVTS